MKEQRSKNKEHRSTIHQLCHPLYGFFLLPGHLGGSIEHCSWIRSPMERFGLRMRPLLWISLVLLRRVCLGGISPKIHPSPPPPHLSLSKLPIRAHSLCLRVGQFGGEGVGGVTQNRSGRLYFVTGSPLPHPSHLFRYKLVLGQRGCFRV